MKHYRSIPVRVSARVRAFFMARQQSNAIFLDNKKSKVYTTIFPLISARPKSVPLPEYADNYMSFMLHRVNAPFPGKLMIDESLHATIDEAFWDEIRCLFLTEVEKAIDLHGCSAAIAVEKWLVKNGIEEEMWALDTARMYYLRSENAVSKRENK